MSWDLLLASTAAQVENGAVSLISARYWRMSNCVVAGKGGTSDPRCAEMRVWEYDGSTLTELSDATLIAACSSNEVFGTETPSKMFDSSLTTIFRGLNNTGSLTLTFDFGSGNDLTVGKLSLQGHSTLADAQFTITEFDLDYSSDGSSWTNVGSYGTATQYTASETREYDVTADVTL